MWSFNKKSKTYVAAMRPKTAVAAHNAESGMTSGTPKMRGRALISSRTLPRDTTPGIRSHKSIQTLPGDKANAIRESEGSGAKNPCLDDKWPSFHPVEGPISSARSKTLRAGAPSAAASTSVSGAISASLSLTFFVVCLVRGLG